MPTRTPAGRRRVARPFMGARGAPFIRASSLSGQSVVQYRMRSLRSFGTVRSQEYEAPQTSRLADIASCRDAYRNNGIFRRIVHAEVENVVGTGFRILPTTSDRQWNALARQYLDARTSEAHFAFPNLPGRSEWGVHLLACFHHSREGGVFVYRSSRGVQLFEEAQCQTPRERVNSALCRDGMQFNADGTLEGYWIGDYSATDGYPAESNMTLIPAFLDHAEFGRLQVTNYIHSGSFASGLRGTAPLACVIDDLERFGDYYDAVSERAAQEANIVGVHKTDRKGGTKSAFNVARNGSDTTDDTVDDAYPRVAYLEAGAVIPIGTDEDFTIEGLQTPGGHFDPFTKMAMRFIGAPVSMPIEILLLHFSDTNFSASKAAIEQFRIACRMQKRRYVESYTVPNYRMAIYEAIRDGDLPWRDDWWRSVVVPSGWRSLQEGEEAKAAIERMNSGITTPAFEMANLFDRQPEDNVREIIETLATIDAAADAAGQPRDLVRQFFFSNPFDPKLIAAGVKPGELGKLPAGQAGDKGDANA